MTTAMMMTSYVLDRHFATGGRRSLPPRRWFPRRLPGESLSSSTNEEGGHAHEYLLLVGMVVGTRKSNIEAASDGQSVNSSKQASNQPTSECIDNVFRTER
mmetsp:Transcript_30458/g.71874  ORF Transcript_30458/g.71874 Transcript_30458/m.71874 type:complete len:101 (-) Transcript_30458:67-369(-)